MDDLEDQKDGHHGTENEANDHAIRDTNRRHQLLGGVAGLGGVANEFTEWLTGDHTRNLANGCTVQLQADPEDQEGHSHD